MSNHLLRVSVDLARRTSSLILKRSITTTLPVCGNLRDYRPGPYPKTEAERIAAAKKYGMSPSEYRPQADDGIGFGDYPDMPNISGDMKSDYESYDYPSIKRNFGEPLHIYSELMTPDKVSHKQPLDGISMMQKLLVFLTTVTVVFGLHFLLRDYKFFVPVMPKQYPRDVERGAQKHYVF